MSNLRKLFGTSKSLETEGIWIEYGGSSDAPIRIRVARAGGANKNFSKTFERLSRPYQRAFQTKTIDPELAERLLAEVYATAVVLEWQNVTDDEGKAIPLSKETALKLFLELPDLFADLREQASNMALFREEILEEELGNSGQF